MQNFLALCASGYYDGCTFHRNIKQFIVQGGDPTGTGKNGVAAGGGFIDDEFAEALKHNQRGIVAMANKGPNTNGEIKSFISKLFHFRFKGSQFYITYGKAAHLDNVSTIFGRYEVSLNYCT